MDYRYLTSRYKMFKNFLINKMSEIQSVGHFLRTSTGYKSDKLKDMWR